MKASLEIPSKSATSRRYRFLCIALIAIGSSFGISWASYSFQDVSGFNFLNALASLIFWIAIVGLIFRFPLNSVLKPFASYIRSKKGMVIFAAYMGVHLLVYGFILEAIIASLSGASATLIFEPFIGIFSSTLLPKSFGSILVGFFLSPNITLTIVPTIGASLALYSIAMALVIGVLVLTNVMKALELRNVCSRVRRSTAIAAMPIIGVIGGASCCLSLPLFVTLLAPAAIFSSSYQVAYYVTYFLFPSLTTLVLKLNLSSINKITKGISRQRPGIGK